MIEKKCTKCLLVKPLSEFYPSPRGKHGRQSACKKCDAIKAVRWNTAPENRDKIRASARRYWASHPEHRKRKQAKNRLRLTGCTPEQFEKLRTEQDFRCAICRRHESKVPRGGLCADHCHKKGAVRGLLCFKCNQGIGIFDESPEILAAAIRFIQKHSK